MSYIKNTLNYYKLKNKYKKINTIIKSRNIASDIVLEDNCLINKRVVIGSNVKIGRFTYLNTSKYWTTIESNVKIGRFCSIAPNVFIAPGNHDYSYVTTHPILFDKSYDNKLNMQGKQKVNGLKDVEEETIIGNDVWIGYNVVIKRGVKIGNGAVIAAGSIVTKDIPSYAVVGGVPAKVIKYRTSKENIEYFENHEDKMWWNWDLEKIKDNLHILYDFEEYKKYCCSLEELE